MISISRFTDRCRDRDRDKNMDRNRWNFNICDIHQYEGDLCDDLCDRDVTRPQLHEAEAEAEATTHEAEAEATTHEAEAEATTHEAEAEAKATTHEPRPIPI